MMDAPEICGDSWSLGRSYSKTPFMTARRRLERNNNRRGRLTGTRWLAAVTGSHCAATEGGLQDDQGAEEQRAPAATQPT